MTGDARGLVDGRARWLLAAASTAIALAAADTYVVVLALTDMMSGVGLGIDAMQRATPIVSGFLLGYVAVLPLIGRLTDLLDRRTILLGCLVIFVVGSVVTAMAVELSVLIGGRFLQGVGGGGLVPATLALVADLWPAHRRGMPLGVVGAVQELGSVIGPVFGALVLAVWDWRGIFWINAVLGVALYVLIRWLGAAASTAPGDATAASSATPSGATQLTAGSARPSWKWRLVLGLALAGGAGCLLLALAAPRALVTSVAWGAPFVPFAGTSRLLTPLGVAGLVLLGIAAALAAPRWWAVLRRADLLGATLIGVALGSLILTFATSDPEKEVVGPLGMTLLPIGAVAVALAVVWHRLARNPLVPRGSVRGRAISALLCSFLVGAALVAIVVDVPLLARLTLTESMTDAALVLVRFLLAVPVGAVLGGWLLRRLGAGWVAAPGLLLAAAGLRLMAGWDRHSMDAALPTTLALVMAGLGIGLALAPVNAAALDAAPEDFHGGISSLIVVARMIGMVVGLALLTAIGLHRYFDQARTLDNPTAEQLLDAGVVQVQTVFTGGSLAALAAALIALTLGTARGDRESTYDRSTITGA